MSTGTSQCCACGAVCDDATACNCPTSTSAESAPATECEKCERFALWHAKQIAPLVDQITRLHIKLDEAADKSLRQAEKYSSVINEFLALKAELERCKEAIELIKRITHDALTK